jgi:tetratricopeptide (TPR) repeat protein
MASDSDVAARAPRLVFFGNCQVQTLLTIYNRYVRPYTGFSTYFVDAHANDAPDSYETLASADIVVTQEGAPAARMTRDSIPASAATHIVPVVSGGFLWPLQGQPHAIPIASTYGNPPYMPEYCDSFLNNLIRKGTSPEDARTIYRNADLPQLCHVDRLYELTMDAQRQRDSATGYSCAAIIEQHLQHEALFQSAFHFDVRILKHLACTLFERMGVDRLFIDRIQNTLRSSPFFPRWVPIHPSIARHFKLQYISDDTRYPFMSEGSYTFDEYVLRYMRAEWNRDLEEGMIDAHRGTPSASARLASALLTSPHAGNGYHALSHRLAQEGRTEEALEACRNAAMASPDNPAVFHSLGRLCFQAGDLVPAEAAFQKAADLDPVNWDNQAWLRDVRLQLARDAAAAAADLAPNPAAARKALEQIDAIVRNVPPRPTGARPAIVMNFSRTGNGHYFLGDGWANQEEHFVWSVGSRSSLIVPYLDRQLTYRLEFDINGCYFPPDVTLTDLEVLVGDAVIGTFKVGSRATHACDITPALIGDDHSVRIDFSHPKFVVPANFGHPDRRELAICFFAATVTPV